MIKIHKKGIGEKNLTLCQTRFGRIASDYDLHEMAGGLPLPVITAPNVHHTSKRRREVYNPCRKSNVPYK